MFKVNPEYKGPVEERGEDGEKIVKPAVEPYDPLADTTPNLIRTEIKDVSWGYVMFEKEKLRAYINRRSCIKVWYSLWMVVRMREKKKKKY